VLFGKLDATYAGIFVHERVASEKNAAPEPSAPGKAGTAIETLLVDKRHATIDNTPSAMKPPRYCHVRSFY
jgi:hypothetical protein